MTEDISQGIPGSLSAQEGILLLSLHMRANIRRIEEARRSAAADTAVLLDELLAEKRELLWRFRSILAESDSFNYNEAASQAALLESTGLSDLARLRTRLPRFNLRRRKLTRRITAALELERRFESLAGDLREHFPDDPFRDEFRLSAQLGDEHLARLEAMRQGPSTGAAHGV